MVSARVARARSELQDAKTEREEAAVAMKTIQAALMAAEESLNSADKRASHCADQFYENETKIKAKQNRKPNKNENKNESNQAPKRSI